MFRSYLFKGSLPAVAESGEQHKPEISRLSYRRCCDIETALGSASCLGVIIRGLPGTTLPRLGELLHRVTRHGHGPIECPGRATDRTDVTAEGGGFRPVDGRRILACWLLHRVGFPHEAHAAETKWSFQSVLSGVIRRADWIH